MSTMSASSRSMTRQLLSMRAFRMPICTPMRTTANATPRTNRANRTRSWVRLHQATGTGRAAGMGYSEQVRGVGGVDLPHGQERRPDAHPDRQPEDRGGREEV